MTGFVTPRPANLPLSPHHVDLWLIPTTLPEPTLHHLFSLLSPFERDRISRLRIPAKQTEALVSRGTLRHILGTLLHQPPSALAFHTGPQGKPHLAENPINLRFNLSHTAGWILLGITLNHELGVDIENLRPRSSLEDLAQRFFTPHESAALLALPESDRPRAFFTIWCRKESLLKAAGQGISAGLNSFDVPLHPLAAALKIHFAKKPWYLHDLPVHDSLAASLAIEQSPITLRPWSWQSPTP